jgi:hypothetical protein
MASQSANQALTLLYNTIDFYLCSLFIKIIFRRIIVSRVISGCRITETQSASLALQYKYQTGVSVTV